ncbi:MAG: hypothetical protein RJA29_2558, partial [Pseudomonadota bacterium]
ADAAHGAAATEARYRRFMERFWQRSMAEPGRLNLREFDGITSLACSNERLSQTDMNPPFVIVNVDARGQVSSFDPELLAVHTERFGDFTVARRDGGDAGDLDCVLHCLGTRVDE